MSPYLTIDEQQIDLVTLMKSILSFERLANHLFSSVFLMNCVSFLLQPFSSFNLMKKSVSSCYWATNITVKENLDQIHLTKQ